MFVWNPRPSSIKLLFFFFFTSMWYFLCANLSLVGATERSIFKISWSFLNYKGGGDGEQGFSWNSGFCYFRFCCQRVFFFSLHFHKKKKTLSKRSTVFVKFTFGPTEKKMLVKSTRGIHTWIIEREAIIYYCYFNSFILIISIQVRISIGNRKSENEILWFTRTEWARIAKARWKRSTVKRKCTSDAAVRPLAISYSFGTSQTLYVLCDTTYEVWQ